MKKYPSDLTDNQWQVIKELLENGRRRRHELREIMNGILYITKSGCQWRMLPKEFAPWQTVYYYFRQRLTETSVAFVQLSMIRVMLNKF